MNIKITRATTAKEILRQKQQHGLELHGKRYSFELRTAIHASR